MLFLVFLISNQSIFAQFYIVFDSAWNLYTTLQSQKAWTAYFQVSSYCHLAF